MPAEDFTYNGTKIVQCNGTSGTPLNFADMYNADLAGTLELLAAWDPDSNTKALTKQVQPAESKGLKIDFVVIGKSADPDYIFITGTDIDGNAQTESLDVSAGDGTYTTTKWFATITNIDCSDNAAGGGTVWFDGVVQVRQNRWGVIHADLGPEKVVNGIFANWTDDDPDGWDVEFESGAGGPGTRDPEISQVATGQSHTDAGGETGGMCNFYMTEGKGLILTQNIATVIGRKYRLSINFDTITASKVRVHNIGHNQWPAFTSDATGVHSVTFVCTQTNTSLLIEDAFGALTDVTFDDVSIKEVVSRYKIDCDIDFGDGVTSSYFQSKNEVFYFADGKVFIITSNAHFWMGELSNGYGINGSYCSLAPSSNLTIIADGTTGEFHLYDSTLRSRNKDLHFKDGTIAINKGKIIFDIDEQAVRFYSAINSLSIKGLYVIGYRLLIDKQPTDFEEVHIHNSVEGLVTGQILIIDGLLVTNASSYDVRQYAANTLTLKDPKFHPSTVLIGDVSGIIIEPYTCNIHTTDKDGADLASVDVDCEYAHLVEGTDSKTYKCKEDFTASDDTYKPVTGGSWEDKWELFDANGGLGGDWNNNNFDYKSGTEEFSTATTDADGDISEQVIQYKKWTTTDELLEARIHKFTFTHASYPDFVMSDIIADHPLVWEVDMGQSTSDLTAIIQAAEISLADDAITSAKYDESTAFPVSEKQSKAASTIVLGTVDTTEFEPTTTEFEADDITEATPEHYKGRIAIWTSGALKDQATDVTNYALTGGRGHFTVTAMTEAPGNNDTFVIV